MNQNGSCQRNFGQKLKKVAARLLGTPIRRGSPEQGLIPRALTQMPDDNRTAVLLPAKDEALVIAGTLQSVLSAGVLPSDVHVIDDGSADSTGEIARGFGVNVVRNEKSLGKAGAIRRGVEHFQLTRRYTHIALMDADTQVSPDYFRAVANTFRTNPEAGVVCGRARSMPHNWLTAYRSLMYAMTNTLYRGGQSNMGVITVAPGCAASYRADVFAQLEWSADTCVEDMDVTIQVHRKKLGRIVFQPAAVVSTQDPRTIRDYVKQMVRWHSGTWQVGLKHKMWSGLAPIDLEYKLLMGEGLIFAAMFLLLPLWLALRPRWTAWALVLDAAALMLLSLLCAIADCRMDVLAYAPIYPLMRFLDCGVFLWSFCRTAVLGQQGQKWSSVKRYQTGA